jgi:hypothetical protein
MTHLTMEQLLSARDPVSSPGTQQANGHLESCAACRAELDRLHQRTAQLKALPMLRPPRNRWPQVRAQLVARRRTRRMTVSGIGGFALAASVALFYLAGSWTPSVGEAEAQEAIATAIAQSQVLENALGQYRPEHRVTDGRTALVISGLETEIAEVDRRLQLAEMRQRQDDAVLRLWRQRVGLMDALVSVHLTRATNAGL